jgi:hypothetical protein
MRKKDYTVYVVLFLTLAAIVIFTVYMAGKKPARFNWNKSFEDGLVEPYDVGVFKEVLKKKSVKGLEEIRTDLTTLNAGALEDSATYVFIGKYCYLGKKQVEKLLEYAFNGHDVLLIAEGVPDTLLQALSYYAKPVSYSRFDDNKVHIRASKKNTRARTHHFRFRGFDQDTLQQTDWYYLDEAQQLDYFYGETGNRYIRRSYVNNRLNYAQFKVGNGFIYLHTSPVLFSNFALRKDSAFYYLNDVFDGVRTDRILYDTYSRTYRDDSEPIKRQSDSPLSYILKQPALKWAWYIFLSTVLLFFLLRARRTQRIIPVLE